MPDCHTPAPSEPKSCSILISTHEEGGVMVVEELVVVIGEFLEIEEKAREEGVAVASLLYGILISA